jgi:hypothetical protein
MRAIVKALNSQLSACADAANLWALLGGTLPPLDDPEHVLTRPRFLALVLLVLRGITSLPDPSISTPVHSSVDRTACETRFISHSWQFCRVL